MKRSRLSSALTLGCLALGVCSSRAAMADADTFEWNGKIYIKGLFCSDDSQGAVWLGNPFWDDNITGCNGVAPELELTLRGVVSPNVTAGARIQSRWGYLWQDFWENGDIKLDENGNPVPMPGDSSGESLGMNHAKYMKLRGVWVDMAPPIPTVRSVHVGSTDFGMFNSWTIGKLRYEDRDNGEGVFVQGQKGGLAYHGGVMAMPKLWAGPNWTTGMGDSQVDRPFVTEDWAYGLKLSGKPFGLETEWIGSYMIDREINPLDPDAQGSINPDGPRDGIVDKDVRYQNFNTTLEADAFPIDWLHTNVLVGYSWSSVNANYAYNGVAENQGFYPMPYGEVGNLASFKEKPFASAAARVTFEALDPLGVGLTARLQYFNIGEDWTATMGARRGDDVLLTDGFIEGGQLPTLNIANEFMDWNMPFYESAIGWHGATLLLTQQLGAQQVEGEATWLTFNTNGQDRDVDTVYPDFLHTDGYTDLDFFDYANATDRGRDPRSVYHENMERSAQIFVLKHQVFAPIGKGVEIKTRGKYIRDRDERILEDGAGQPYTDDDYQGDLWSARTEASYQFNPELRGFVGDQVDKWNEIHRSGTPEAGYYDYVTRKNKALLGFEYRYGGARLWYEFQWLYKHQSRALDTDPTTDGYEFEVADYKRLMPWRSKVTFEVAW